MVKARSSSAGATRGAGSVRTSSISGLETLFQYFSAASTLP
jgi:hypothetical protein